MFWTRAAKIVLFCPQPQSPFIPYFVTKSIDAVQCNTIQDCDMFYVPNYVIKLKFYN